MCVYIKIEIFIHTLHTRLVVAVSPAIPTLDSLQSPVEHGRVGGRYRSRPELCRHWHVTVADVQYL